MNNKYKEQIIITRTSESGIAIDCHAELMTIERSVIGLFKTINHLDKKLGKILILNLIDIAEGKE